MKKLALLTLLSALLTGNVLGQTNPPASPTDEEVQLLLTQTERAMDQYAVLIQQEDKLLAGAPDVDTTTDKKLVGFWKTIDKLLRKNPGNFNSRAGFDLLILIDDAARNASLAATSAAKMTSQEIIDRNTAKAELLVTLMQNAASASTLLYTVSENCTALYQKYLGFMEAFTAKALTVMDSCTEHPKN